MEKKRLTKKEKEKLIPDLYNIQNKTYRQITELTGSYPREITAILKKADPSRSQSVSSQAYQLFSEGNTAIQVAVALDIRQPQVSELFLEYLQLDQQDQLYRIFHELKGNIYFFLRLYKQTIAAGMNVRDVIRVLKFTNNDLRSVEYRYQELNRQAENLAASNRNAANTFQDLSDQISEMRKKVEQYQSYCEEKKLELDKISELKNNLEVFITNIRNNSKEYSKIIEIVKREIANALTDPRQTIMLVYRSIVECARKDIGNFYALIHNSPVVNTSPDYITNEDIYERVLLNEVEEIYANTIINQVDEAISNTASKSEVSLKSEDRLDNIKKDPTLFVAYSYKRKEEQTFIQSDGRKNEKYTYDEGQIT